MQLPPHLCHAIELETAQHNRPLLRLRPNQHGRLIPCDHRIHRRTGHGSKTAAAIIAKDGQPPALSTANHQVIPSVAIQVPPGHAGPQLAQFFR